MKARRLIESSAFGPEKLKLLGQAFDEAWAEIASHFDTDDETARIRLAHALLAVAREDDVEPQDIKKRALRVMALGYRG